MDWNRWNRLGLAVMVLVYCSAAFGQNQAPTAVIAVTGKTPVNNKIQVVKGEVVQFVGSGSSDPERAALKYLWSFGDGQTSTLANPSHTYAQAGTYTVTLVVDDGYVNAGSFSPPNLWYDNLDYADMRGVTLAGSVRLAPGEMPNQPAGVWTGFVYNPDPGRVQIVQDATNCRSGSWCGKVSLGAGQQGGNMTLWGGYGTGNVLYGSNQHQFYRMYIKWPVGYSLKPYGGDAVCQGKLMYMRANRSGGTVMIKFVSGTGGLTVMIENTDPSANSPTSKWVPADGNWHYLEVELDPAAQKIRMWIDDPVTPVIDWSTPINPSNIQVDDTKFGMYMNQTGHGACFNNTGQTQIFWLDDMAQSNSRIGP